MDKSRLTALMWRLRSRRVEKLPWQAALQEVKGVSLDYVATTPEYLKWLRDSAEQQTNPDRKQQLERLLIYWELQLQG